MAWWGKLLGGTFGLLVGGPLGALLGGAMGHQLDRGLAGVFANQEQIQAAFFAATFSVMGRLAKVDGRVSEQEIAFARSVMERMALNSAQREAAIRLFQQGKDPAFDLDGVLEQFRQVCQRRQALLRMFLEIQLQAAYADGNLDQRERALLLHLCSKLGFPAAAFAQLDMLVRAARHFTGTGGSGGPAPPAPRRDLLKEAYALLGVASDSSNDEVKRAYRRLINQHHPDKLVAKGLPEEMVRLANEKTGEIKQAYELVKESRGMR